MNSRKISRREFLSMAGIAAGAAALAACGGEPTVVKETSIVKETEIVSQTEIVTVKETVVVPPTEIPLFVTPQGRELPADAAPLEKQVLQLIGSEPKFFDTARDIYSSGATNTGTEPLLRNNEDFELVPALAESWKAGDEAKWWEFVIRKDAVWSDGNPIIADDIVYTYQHSADPAMANPWVWFYFDIKDVYKVATGAIAPADGKSAEKVDDRTVRIYGEYGSIPYLPALLSYQASVVVPKHVVEKDPAGWANTIEGFVSCGPYIPTVWDHNKQVVWEINDKYNGPHKPGVQKIVNVIFPTGTNTLNAWLNQEVELIHILDQVGLATFRADPKLAPLIHFFNNFQSTYVALNTNMPPLDNMNFRKALAHAIDRDTMCNQVLNGTYVAGYSMLPPGFPAYNPELKALQVFDLEQAQKYLADSGIDPATVTIELYQNGNDVMLQFVQQQWQTNLGIKVNLNLLDGAVWGQMRADHAMMAYRGPYEYDFIDPSNMLTGLWRSVTAPEGKSEPWGSPRHAWKNEEFDRLVTEAGSEVDVPKRLQMFMDAEKILCDEVGGAFLGHQVVFQIWWPWIVGMHPDKTGNVVYRWLDIALFQMYIHKDVDQLKEQYKM
jgi:oligopeptide transport system substrate-binding protein